MVGYVKDKFEVGRTESRKIIQDITLIDQSRQDDNLS